jgi:cytochrome bd ubiquinol oxidase subunit I
MRSAEAVSPVSGAPIAMSLAAFILTYGFVFGAGSYYILKLIGKGPDTEEDAYGSHGVIEPPLVTGLVAEKGGRHV